MNKKDVISKVKENVNYNKSEIEEIFDCIVNTISDSITNGETIKISGFGIFKPKELKARIGVNPSNPTEKINIPASKSVSFKVSSTLKDKINGK